MIANSALQSSHTASAAKRQPAGSCSRAAPAQRHATTKKCKGAAEPFPRRGVCRLGIARAIMRGKNGGAYICTYRTQTISVTRPQPACAWRSSAEISTSRAGCSAWPGVQEQGGRDGRWPADNDRPGDRPKPRDSARLDGTFCNRRSRRGGDADPNSGDRLSTWGQS
jgi:hypothetical protein